MLLSGVAFDLNMFYKI